MIHFSTSIEYILDYVDCLLNWNEIDNACILLENSIQIIGQDMSSALWEKLLFIQQNYSMNHLSLSILSQVEYIIKVIIHRLKRVIILVIKRIRV